MLYTKRETSRLTGVGLKQLDYWGRDKIGIVPKSISFKYSNVTYGIDQVFEILYALHLKKQGFKDEWIAGFLMCWREDGYSRKPVLIKLSKFEEDVKHAIDNFNLEVFESRLFFLPGEEAGYAIVTKEELQKYMLKILDYDKADSFHYFKLNIPSRDVMAENLKEVALREGIEMSDVA